MAKKAKMPTPRIPTAKGTRKHRDKKNDYDRRREKENEKDRVELFGERPHGVDPHLYDYFLWEAINDLR